MPKTSPTSRDPRSILLILLAAVLACDGGGDSARPAPTAGEHANSAAPLATTGGSVAPAGPWPQFRGPRRDGVSAEALAPHAWPDTGPPVLWRKEIGPGFSGVSVVGSRLYTAYADDENELALCLDAADGAEVWRFAMAATFREEWGDGPRATPTVDTDTVYVTDSRGTLYAIAREDGGLRWKRDLLEGGKVEQRGHASSVLLEGDLLIVQVGPRPGTAIIALDKRDGSPRWAALDGRAAQSSPIAATIAGKRQIVANIASGMVGVALDGTPLWSFAWGTDFGLNVTTPLLVPDGRLFISTGYDKGAALVAVEGDGDSLHAASVWEERLFRNHFNSSVLHDGNIYGFDNATLKSIRVLDAGENWKVRGLGKGSLILAGSTLIVLGEEGTLVLAEATPESYREVARAPLLPDSGKCWTSPSIADGVVYARNHRQLVAVSLRP